MAYLPKGVRPQRTKTVIHNLSDLSELERVHIATELFTNGVHNEEMVLDGMAKINTNWYDQIMLNDGTRFRIQTNGFVYEINQ